eukprot:scaffold288940_cov32-Prasinocladus_malaysianus.AAC.1
MGLMICVLRHWTVRMLVAAAVLGRPRPRRALRLGRRGLQARIYAGVSPGQSIMSCNDWVEA